MSVGDAFFILNMACIVRISPFWTYRKIWAYDGSTSGWLQTKRRLLIILYCSLNIGIDVRFLHDPHLILICYWIPQRRSSSWAYSIIVERLMDFERSLKTVTTPMDVWYAWLNPKLGYMPLFFILVLLGWISKLDRSSSSLWVFWEISISWFKLNMAMFLGLRQLRIRLK